MGILHRRQIRTKVLQALYTYHVKGDESTVSVKTLMISIEKVYEMYIYLLQAIVELKHIAEQKIEENKKKRLPTEEDITPNLKFVENPILCSLCENKRLKKLVNDYHVNWSAHDYSMLTKIWKIIKESSEYQSYMAKNSSELEDLKILESIFRKYIANNENLQDFFESESIFWVDDLDLVCINVLKTLENIHKKEVHPIKTLYKNRVDDLEFAEKLYRQSTVHFESSLDLIHQYAKNWEVDRIALMDKILMSMAIAEAITFSQIPLKVSLNEFVELSKSYSTPKSNVFINGILDKIFKQLKEEGKIKKKGRGLIE